MATASLEHDDHSKRDRILNALAVYPDGYQLSNKAVAELTGASASYVYQLRAAINAGDLTDEELQQARDERLRAEYRDRLPDRLEKADVPRGGGTAPAARTILEDAMQGATGAGSSSSVPVEEIRRIRAVMERYREDAAFERERFQGAGKNIAEEKYFIANRAVELIDDVIEG